MRKSLAMTFVLAALLAVVFCRPPSVMSFGGCEEDCQKCHRLEQREVQDILSKMNISGAKIIGIKMSPIRGLWEVAVEEKGNRRIIYVGFSKKYVVGGSIYEVDTAVNKTRETIEGMNTPPDRYVDASKISLAGSLVMGDKEAPYKVIVFTDPECPYCAKLHAELKKVLAGRKDIAFFLKLMPLKMHPDAYWKAQSILCDGSLSLLEENFEKRPIPKPSCAPEMVDENIRLGAELGITGTPTLIMPDGLVAEGLRDASAIIELVNKHQKRGAS